MVTTPLAPADPSSSALTAARRLRRGLGLVRRWLERPFYALYERRLTAQVAEWRLPRHIGVIMDGNRRFARELAKSPVSFGHARGAEKLHQLLGWCYDFGIPVVTVWSFSLDNFQRDTSEVEHLFQLFEDKTRELARRSELKTNEVRVRYIGKLNLLPESLQEAIRSVEQQTAAHSRFHLNIAMAYGGREEITDAFRRYLAEQAERGRTLDQAREAFDDTAIEPYLYLSGLPEPDLILRTSGEVRLSGFLLWQSAYSELFFADTYWPSFRKIDFLRALRSFHERHRRYGR
jgi:short-chain Z-isoprenyl diphosphate synthase